MLKEATILNVVAAGAEKCLCNAKKCKKWDRVHLACEMGHLPEAILCVGGGGRDGVEIGERSPT